MFGGGQFTQLSLCELFGRTFCSIFGIVASLFTALNELISEKEPEVSAAINMRGFSKLVT
jgi:hypothetical protein